MTGAGGALPTGSIPPRRRGVRRILARLALLLPLVLGLPGCESSPQEPTLVIPLLYSGATEVDRLLLTGEFLGVTPGGDMEYVLAELPQFEVADTGVLTLLVSTKSGVGVMSEPGGARVQVVWIEYVGGPKVPMSGLASGDGLLRAGAPEADVVRYLEDRGLPLVIASYPAEDSAAGVEIREYYVDAVQTWITVRGGTLARILSANLSIYDPGRARAALQQR